MACALALACVVAAAPARGQQRTEVEDLARLRANPLSGLRNLTLQDQVNFDFPAAGKAQNMVTLQAVWPFSIGADWSCITQTVLPVTSQSGSEPGEGDVSGLGDLTFNAALTPNEAGALIWGVGLLLDVPTATDHELGSDLWAAGPALALFVEPDPWTVGVLLENAWSFAGAGDGRIDELSVEYFLTYNLPDGWFLQSNATITADWEAEPRDRWTVPVGGGFGKVFSLGGQSVSASTQALYNAARPDVGPDWSLLLALQILFP